MFIAFIIILASICENKQNLCCCLAQCSDINQMRTAETSVSTVLLSSAGDKSIWTKKPGETGRSVGEN